MPTPTTLPADLLRARIGAALAACYPGLAEAQELSLQPTGKQFTADYTLLTFPLSKPLRQAPDQVARTLGVWLVDNAPEVEEFEAVKGFLNLTLTPEVWTSGLQAMSETEDLGQHLPSGQKVLIEYSSPNTNKPLHLGHLRNNFLGSSLSKILKAGGDEVITCNLINDRGIHICKSMIAYQKFGNGETPESAGLKGDKLVGKYYVKFDQEYRKEVEALTTQGKREEEAKAQAPLLLGAQELLRQWEAGDADTVALWKLMNGWVYDGFDVTYQTIGVEFDKFYYESDTYLLGKDIVQEGLKSGVFTQEADGSVWCDLTGDGLDRKIVQRGDGTAVYITQDMGTADLKYQDFQMDRSLYVVGDEQEYHFQVLKLMLQKLGKPYAAGIHHFSYGMVDLPSGKMKSREGTVVDADDLIAEMQDTAAQRTTDLGKIEGFSEAEKQELFHTLGLGALKYFLLRVDPRKRMLFNPEESIDFQGQTGPFIQYTHARIRALLRKAEQAGIAPVDYTQLPDLEEPERVLLKLLANYPDKTFEAAREMSPAVIAQYAYDLAKGYNRLYQELPILAAEDEAQRALRLELSAQVARVIKQAMGLLGIAVPERM